MYSLATMQTAMSRVLLPLLLLPLQYFLLLQLLELLIISSLPNLLQRNCRNQHQKRGKVHLRALTLLQLLSLIRKD